MTTGFIQRASCPLCQSSGSRILSEIAYGEPRLADYIEAFYAGRVPLAEIEHAAYRVVACPDCAFVYQDSVLDEQGMQSLYRDWVDHAQSLRKKRNAGTRLFRQYAGQLQTLARLFAAAPGQVRILDYGMGWGYWSRMAQAHGYDVSGYELASARREHARAMGISVIDSLPEAGAHYDFIFANQVFEHLADPLQTLQGLCARLDPGGVVYLRVPDGHGVAARLARSGWSPDLDAIHPLEHINCFTRETLIALAGASGLKPFNPPLRLNWGSLRGGLKREYADRFVTTHVYFRRQH